MMKGIAAGSSGLATISMTSAWASTAAFAGDASSVMKKKKMTPSKPDMSMVLMIMIMIMNSMCEARSSSSGSNGYCMRKDFNVYVLFIYVMVYICSNKSMDNNSMY